MHSIGYRTQSAQHIANNNGTEHRKLGRRMPMHQTRFTGVTMEKRRLLIADDSELNRAILANILEQDYDIIEVTGGEEALAALQSYRGEISALLLDIVMPGMGGFEVLEEMRRRQLLDEVPTIMISAETGNAYIDRAFTLGAFDYISRPFAPAVVRHRIINTILMHTKKQQLMDVAAGWFHRQEKNSEVLVSVLCYGLEYRCGERGLHMKGVGRLTAMLLRRLLEVTDRYPLSADDIEVIAMAARLHDIGKLLVPSELLKKPSPLSAEELVQVRRHTLLGAQIVSGLMQYRNEELVKYAVTVCRFHHERWNGDGYPEGLAGDAIPIAAQVVSLADAYDALTSKRSYKEAYTHEQALEMIRAGESGSFNPLLLRCLDDISEEVRQYVAERNRVQDSEVRRAVEELYGRQDIMAARVTHQIEEASAKQEYFSALTEELWFEYTVQPSAVNLSRGACEQTGLPAVTVDPQNNVDFLAVVGSDTVRALRERLETLPSDETHIELMVDIMLGGRLRRCRLTALVIRSVSSSVIGCSCLVGKVDDINDSYARLEEYDRESENEITEQVLLPVTAGAEDVLRITHGQVGAVLQCYRKMFSVVRLVDPGICMQVSTGALGHTIEHSEHCYSAWNRFHRCENCISQEAIRTSRTQSKVETDGGDVYYVLASRVEIDGIPYSLECVNPISSEASDTDNDESILGQLLVRNRQVYIDSMTGVFNRRYYDERIRNLTGEHALAMIDIDNFKHINDAYGHPAGDEALRSVAQTIRFILRSSDELIRYGGDEFFLLFHGLPERSLARKLDEICSAVRRIKLPEHPELQLTVSIGGIYASGRVTELIRKADIALYEAKTERGRAVIYNGNASVGNG